MRIRRQIGLAALLVTLGSGAASAQSPYAGAALVGDVLRSTHSESTFGREVPDGGEAIGFALRVGTPLGARWGVELEFTRPGEIETELAGGPIPLSRADTITSLTTAAIGSTLIQVLPQPVSYSLNATERHSTLSTTMWFAQQLSPKVSLVYLAGMGFFRATYESEFRFDILPGGIASPLVPSRTRTVNYGVRPLAGFEARLKLTEHVDLVPGVRLHGLENSWLLRPAVGLAWNF
jgi:hypothetical protein